ncbi:b binding protein CP29 [Seminavis robusta]|uniref:B binding protein CP29 n=1 Tax=Seminavis robusta TaxID=568900 RepID=A0A9N8EGV8_9STRA|nr:b binding protein CP29 [Seminavis robusta]|eukprot:Sro975_g226790.1 b binding protein CP29 (253) ;mRNA; f:19483-20325
MKLSVFALLAGSAAAYTTPTMTFAVGKKSAPKIKASSGGTVPSKALPYENAPAALDGSLPGDVGFDPCFLSTKADLMADYFNGLNFVGNPGLSGLEWYREAELMHGRIAQMAVLGFIFPGFTRLPGLEGVSSNPLAAFDEVPYAGVWQTIAFMGFVDLFRISRIRELGSSYTPGDYGWGQGGFNPFGFNYSPEEYYEKQVQETKHGRLAMIALLGLIWQANASGVGVLDQLGPAFSAPDYYARAGYFLPQGI